MRRIALLICAIIPFGFAFAGDPDYNVLLIPQALLKNANVVKRLEEESFELVSASEARYRYKIALTILNEAGEIHSSFYTHYNKFRDLRSFDGDLYDMTGKRIKSVKKSDIKDYSGTDDVTLIDDMRYKFHDFYYKSYPYTVVYEIEVKYDGTMFFPTWLPAEKLMSVEKSRFTAICPSNYNLRYKAFNSAPEPQITEKGNRKTYSWELTNLAAVSTEYASKPLSWLTPRVILGPSEFKMENYSGNMKTWQDFGKFVYELKKGRDQLPQNIKETIHQIADAISDPREKVKRLYEFMQANTRYISIQLGIGGWQPFDATSVATKRYGDCKALSNYMYSLLKEAGIISFYSLIRAGNDQKWLDEDFPSSQFNHVILCVPIQKDTIWLECTSQIAQPGFLGTFTSDRPALLIDENGGKLVKTPKYYITDNLQSRTIKASIDQEGNLTADVNGYYSGILQERQHEMMHYLSKEKVMELLKEEFDLSTYDVNTFDYKSENKKVPVVHEALNLNVTHYASVSGKRLFIAPNILTRHNNKLQMDSARKYTIVMNYEYGNVDTVMIKVPAGYKVESLPKDVSVTTSFGNYKSQIRVNGDQITYYRTYEKKSGEFPAEKYSELANFYEQMYKADRSRVVLVKE